MDNYRVETRPLSALRPDPGQPRKFFSSDDVDSLAASLKAVGLINPIVVDGKNQIIVGELRFRAAKKAGLKEVPVRIIDCSKDEKLRMQLEENINQFAMSPIEIAEALKRVFGVTAVTETNCAEIARKTGKNRQWVLDHVHLLQLAAPIIREIKRQKLPVRTVRALSRIQKLEEEGEVKRGVSKKFAEKVIRGEVRNTDSQARIATAIADNPGAASDYLKPNYLGKSEHEVQSTLDRIAPTMNTQMWDLSTACDGMGKMARSLTKRLKEYAHDDLGSGRNSLLQDFKELKRALAKWHKSLE
jgi:ParB/RepB/Spo0J family partition protein